MKQFAFLSIFLIPILAFSQIKEEKNEGMFYKFGVGTTFSKNENYQLFDESDDPFLVPSTIIANTAIGYQFDQKTSIELNAEYNKHFNQNLKFLPVYLGFRYNILNFDDNVFLRGGYGKLVKASSSYQTGNMYKVGIGYQAFDANFRNSWLIGIDFTRKRFGFNKQEKLSSVSVFLEFQLF